MLLKTINIAKLGIISTLLMCSVITVADTTHSKFKSASKKNAIKNQYIVVLKDSYLNQDVINTQSISGKSSTSKMSRKQKITSVSEHMGKKHRGHIRHQYSAGIGGFAITMDDDQLEEMLEDDRIQYIEQDTMVYPNFTIQGDATLGLDRIDQEIRPLDNQYRYQYTGAGVTAYIVDTGIYSSHSEFGNRVGTGISYISDDYGTEDCDGHGTHVAGTVGGATYGVAKAVTLIPVRVFNCEGEGSPASTIIAALDWITANATLPAVVNMSLSGNTSNTFTTAIDALFDAGVVVVVAAGNDDDDACKYSPASTPNALTIAALGVFEDRASFSNYGDCVDLFAPGQFITSAAINGGYVSNDGTSMATPHAVGVVAMYLEKYPTATPAEVEVDIKANTIADTIDNVQGSPNLLLQTQFLTAIEETLTVNNASDWGGSYGFSAENAIDSSTAWTSRWEATGSPVNLVLDLGSVQNITDVGIAWGQGDSLTYSFEIWARASASDEWTKVLAKGNTSGTTSSITSYNIADIDAQYVRIKTHSNSDASNVTVIKEVELYGSRDRYTDLAIEKAFDDGTSDSSYPASNAIDGRQFFSSRWSAYDKTAVNLTIELDEVSTVTDLAIYWGEGDDYVYTFEVYARAGSSGPWTKVFDDVSDGTTDGLEVFDITDIDAKQVRIKSFGSTDGTNTTTIVEVKAYNIEK